MEPINSHIAVGACPSCQSVFRRGRRLSRLAFSACMLLAAAPAVAQRVLSLDSCRAMALRNNKQLNIAKLKQDVARDARKAVRTKYLPHVDVIGGYEFTSREISILNNKQKGALGSLGITAAGQIFFSLSIGFGTICTYASYVPRGHDIALGSLTANAANEVVEVGIAGMMIVYALV